MPRKSKKTKSSKAKPRKRRLPPYSLRIVAGDTDFKTRADSPREALLKFVDSGEVPFGSKTVATITVEKGKNKHVERMNPLRARRLFLQLPYKSTAVEILAATLERRIST